MNIENDIFRKFPQIKLIEIGKETSFYEIVSVDKQINPLYTICHHYYQTLTHLGFKEMGEIIFGYFSSLEEAESSYLEHLDKYLEDIIKQDPEATYRLIWRLRPQIKERVFYLGKKQDNLLISTGETLAGYGITSRLVLIKELKNNASEINS